jgi:putative redox protein
MNGVSFEHGADRDTGRREAVRLRRLGDGVEQQMAIESRSLPEHYATEFTNGRAAAHADTTADKGGREVGFRPHDLLESALATCINMTVRMVAAERGIPVESVTAHVALDRSSDDETVFEYSLDVRGDLSEPQRRELMDAVATRSSVRRTLSKRLSFRAV